MATRLLRNYERTREYIVMLLWLQEKPRGSRIIVGYRPGSVGPADRLHTEMPSFIPPLLSAEYMLGNGKSIVVGQILPVRSFMEQAVSEEEWNRHVVHIVQVLIETAAAGVMSDRAVETVWSPPLDPL